MRFHISYRENTAVNRLPECGSPFASRRRRRSVFPFLGTLRTETLTTSREVVPYYDTSYAGGSKGGGVWVVTIGGRIDGTHHSSLC